MIPIKSKKEIEIMAEGGKRLAQVMEELDKMVRPGVSQDELNRVARDLILSLDGKPSFEGYEGFPAALCVCVNEQVVHFPPSARILTEGEIVTLDLGLFYQGFHTDLAVTLAVGEISSEARRLILIAKKALKMGIKKVRPGNTFGDLGNTIQRYVESRGFSVIRDLCGHGIGHELHEEPQVLNYGKRGKGLEIKEGMVFCIEPMITSGDYHTKKIPGGFGYQTRDGSLSAHFEHTVAVTKKGTRVLTKM